MSDEIKFKYTKSSDFKTLPATGAWGGVTPHGDISINFFLEQPTIPNSATIKKKDNSIEQDHDPPKAEFEREFQVGIVMRPDRALVVGNWLIERAKMSHILHTEGQKDDLSNK